MKIYNLKSVGKYVKQYRQKRGYSQEKLAEELGVSARHIVYIENEKRQLSFNLFVNIAELLEVSTDELLKDCLFLNTQSDFCKIVSVINQCNPKEADILIKAVSDLYSNISRFKIN